MAKRKITIDDLAAMVANGFSDMSARFNERFDGLEQRLSKLGKGQETFRAEMHDEFRRIHKEIDDIKIKLDQLSERTLEDDDAINRELLGLRQRVENLEKQFKQLKAAKV